jgi:hypothetical protein
MLKGIKRTKNNDLVINSKGLSVLNILCILSALFVLFFFIPIIKVDFSAGFLGDDFKKSFSMFSALLIDPSDSVVGQLAAIKGPILLFLFYPIANIVLWALNKKSTGNRSYIFVHIIYILNVSLGFVEFTSTNGVSGMHASFLSATFFAWILVLLLFINLILSIYGILKTGRTEIDENAVALDINVNYAKEMLNKAGSMANSVASNVSAAASKAGTKTVVCDKCGATCPESSTFCNHCGNNLENAKKMQAQSKASNEPVKNTVVCDNCGAVCAEGTSFCTKCGNKLDGAKNTSDIVDETAKLAREMAGNETAVDKEESDKIDLTKDDTNSNGVSLSK